MVANTHDGLRDDLSLSLFFVGVDFFCVASLRAGFVTESLGLRVGSRRGTVKGQGIGWVEV